MNACSLPQYIKLYLNIHRILDIVILLTSGLTGLVDFMNPRRKSFNHSHLSCSLPLSLWLPLRLCVSFPPSHWRSHSSTVIISSPAPLCWSLSWSSSRLASAVSSKKGIQLIPLLTFHLIMFPLLRSLIDLINSLIKGGIMSIPPNRILLVCSLESLEGVSLAKCCICCCIHGADRNEISPVWC